MLCLLKKQRRRPRYIVMADPGDEHKRTYEYRDEVMNPWLVSVGFPTVTVVTRADEARHRPRCDTFDTLYESCIRNKTLPSAAYGFSGCSDKYKRTPSLWFMERQRWAQNVWRRGEKITKCIGYDLDEPRRIRDRFNDEKENARYVPHYPLFEAKMTREDCEALIIACGLSLPVKSSCKWCPNNTLQDWINLRVNEPDGYERALFMQQNAVIDSPDVVGLMRCMPHGRRQLPVVIEYTSRSCDPEQQCECGT